MRSATSTVVALMPNSGFWRKVTTPNSFSAGKPKREQISEPHERFACFLLVRRADFGTCWRGFAEMSLSQHAQPIFQGLGLDREAHDERQEGSAQRCDLSLKLQVSHSAKLNFARLRVHPGAAA